MPVLIAVKFCIIIEIVEVLTSYIISTLFLVRSFCLPLLVKIVITECHDHQNSRNPNIHSYSFVW